MALIKPKVDCYAPRDVAGAKFAFLFHAPEHTYVQRAFGFTGWAGIIEQQLAQHPPMVLAPMTHFGTVLGANVALPWTPDMMMRDIRGFRKKVYETLEFIRDVLGIRYIGLGALIPSFLHYCRDIEIDGVYLTTGHGATTLLVGDILYSALRHVGLHPQDMTVGIVGAGGSMGRTVFRLIGKHFARVLLFEQAHRLELLHREVVAPFMASGTYTDVRVYDANALDHMGNADAVVVVTNAHQAFITPTHLKNASVVIDDAKPSGVSIKTIEAVRGKTLVLECLAQGPIGLDVGFDFGFANVRQCYGCMFESWVAAELDLQQHFVVGYPTPMQLDVLRMWFQELGIMRAPFTESGGRVISTTEFAQVSKRRDVMGEEVRNALV